MWALRSTGRAGSHGSLLTGWNAERKATPLVDRVEWCLEQNEGQFFLLQTIPVTAYAVVVKWRWNIFLGISLLVNPQTLGIIPAVSTSHTSKRLPSSAVTTLATLADGPEGHDNSG
jgi:hypothetical protein